MVFCIYCKTAKIRPESGNGWHHDWIQTSVMMSTQLVYPAYSRTDISVLKLKLKYIFLNTIEYHSLYKY